MAATVFETLQQTLPSTTVVRHVLLVPGIWMPARSMQWMAAHMQRAGFEVRYLGYAGVLGGPQSTLPRLRRALRDVDAVLAHSLGGLMTIEALRLEPDLPPLRVVCLGSPLSGSQVAAHLRSHRMPWAVGRSGGLLQSGCAWPWPGRAQIGAVAGNAGYGVGRVLGCLQAQGNDGTVTVDETRWPGLSDHIQVRASHSGLLVSTAAAQAALRFLQHGRFAAPNQDASE